MIPKFGPVELILILVIVTMLFGVGKLPEVFGSVGRGIREFRRNSTDLDEGESSAPVEAAPVAAAPATTVTVVAPESTVAPTVAVVSEPADKQVAS